MQENYVLIQQHLSNKGGFQLPAIVPAGRELLYKNGQKPGVVLNFYPILIVLKKCILPKKHMK